MSFNATTSARQKMAQKHRSWERKITFKSLKNDNKFSFQWHLAARDRRENSDGLCECVSSTRVFTRWRAILGDGGGMFSFHVDSSQASEDECDKYGNKWKIKAMNLAEMLEQKMEKEEEREKVVTTNNHKSFNFLFSLHFSPLFCTDVLVRVYYKPRKLRYTFLVVS